MESPIPCVIFVSGFGDVGAREMYAMGVEAFLPKPLQRSDFIASIERALAERSTLWLTRMSVPPKQSMHIEAAGIGFGPDQNLIQLGKGGFSVHYDGSVSLGRVSFQCNLPQQNRQISGEGHVRWRSRSEKVMGIEFDYLDPACRSWVLEAIAAASPRAFIPSF